MRGDTGLVEYSLVYEQVHMPCGNGLNTIVGALRTTEMQCDAYARECMGTDVVMGLEYFDSMYAPHCVRYPPSTFFVVFVLFMFFIVSFITLSLCAL